MEISSSHISVSECKIHENERENSSLITSKPLKKKKLQWSKAEIENAKNQSQNQIATFGGIGWGSDRV